MKKRFIAFILAIVASLCLGVFVSCGQNTGSNTGSQHVWGDEYTISAAYQKATELGYTGSLEEFIAMISGKDGADGQDGKDGADGKDGQDGVGIASVTVNADGEIVITNTNDEVIFKQKLPLCQHDYSEAEVGLPAGCTYAGYSYKVCEKCGDKQYTVLQPLGHDWDNGRVVIQATCTNNGYMYYTCEHCGETKSQILNATGEHSFNEGACEHCGLKYVVYIDEYYNNDYGYRYLATMQKGEDLCAFYDDIAEAVMTFHSDGTDAQYDGNKYVLCYIDFTKYGLEIDEATAVWKTYLDDKPLYYWMSKSAAVSASGLAIIVDDEYADGDARTECNTELYGAIDEYTELAIDENDYTVALAFHDKIIEAIDYAYDRNNKPETSAWAHNITGVLQGRGAVCEGYARTFQLLLNVRSINNLVVTGKSNNVGHAWNLVEIDGEWYWFDLTYDDTPNRYWGISHNYFCVTDESFLNNHTPDNGDGVEFLCELPSRAQSRYDGDDAVFYDTFTNDGAEYAVVGYDTLSLLSITKSGDFVIPSMVAYRGREYSVVSIMNYEDGKQTIQSVLGRATTSVHVSATVRYIHDGDVLNNSFGNIEAITVDENNPYFSAQDGVLFSKQKFMLITYPTGKKSVEYRIPDETGVIAHNAFTWFYTKNLEKLILGKNVRMAGWANWGVGYPDELRGGSIISGEWNNIILSLTGAKQLLVDEQNPYFVIEDDMLFNKSFKCLYAALPNIQTAIIPETVVDIESDAFAYCKNLVSVKLPSSLTVIPSIFTECTSLREVILPNAITTIEGFAFAGCKSLQSIEIPASVQRIDRYAFSGCTSLENIILPEGLKYLDYNAFSGCSKLTKIVVPKSVQYVGAADKIRGPLPSLYYYGTAEEWEAVECEFTYYESPYNPVIYTVNVYFYSEARPTTEGNYWHYVDGAPVAW